ncbi:hypothetical protein [Candidatus Protochlamydia naegleriophila]|nr:hypothetical protein [Candidatus Protochlamydia naegleriophila]
MAHKQVMEVNPVAKRAAVPVRVAVVKNLLVITVKSFWSLRIKLGWRL